MRYKLLKWVCDCRLLENARQDTATTLQWRAMSVGCLMQRITDQDVNAPYQWQARLDRGRCNHCLFVCLAMFPRLDSITKPISDVMTMTYGQRNMQSPWWHVMVICFDYSDMLWLWWPAMTMMTCYDHGVVFQSIRGSPVNQLQQQPGAVLQAIPTSVSWTAAGHWLCVDSLQQVPQQMSQRYHTYCKYHSRCIKDNTLTASTTANVSKVTHLLQVK